MGTDTVIEAGVVEKGASDVWYDDLVVGVPGINNINKNNMTTNDQNEEGVLDQNGTDLLQMSVGMVAPGATVRVELHLMESL